MKTLEQILRWAVIVGIFALPFVPLIVVDSLFFPYITGKNFAFRIVVELITALWLALALIDAKYRPRRSWILACFAIFVVVIAIADAQGVNPFKSFWSNYERMDGWITIAHLLLYIVVAASVLNTENLWRRLFQLSLGVSGLLSILGFFQVLGFFTLGGADNTGLEGRIDTTFGNPIYLAVYMLFHVFIAALLWAQMWRETEPGKRLWPSILYGVVIAADTLALIFTGTRGATLGEIAGAFLALLFFAFSAGGSRKLRQWVIGIFVLLVLCAGGLYAARNTAFVQRVDILDRFATISLSDGDTQARIINIETAWKGIEERPILGWGQENYAIVFDKFYDPRMYAQEQWFDRVHNIVFDWWVAGGTLGLLAYLSIFMVTLWVLWRKKNPGFTNLERAILTGLIAGYFIQNLTVFDNITSYILFGTILAYIVFRTGNARGAPAIFSGEILPRAALPYAAGAAVIIGCLAAWLVNGSAYAENLTLISALEPQQGGAAQNLALFEKAISYGTYGNQEAREQLSQEAAQIVGDSSVSSDIQQQFVQEAVDQMNDQAQISPLDARFPLFTGTVLDAAGDYADAEGYLEHALSLSPKKQQILFTLGLNADAQGSTTAALQYFETAYNLEPDFLQARLYYAAEAIRTRNTALVSELLTPVIANGEAADPSIASAYASINDYTDIVTIWQAHVKADPSDVQGWLTLAAAYYAEHDSSDAVKTLQAAEAANPSAASQIDPLIQEVQSGTVPAQ